MWAAHLLHIAMSGGFAHWLGLDAVLPVLEQIAQLAPSRPLPPNVPARRLTDEVFDCWNEIGDAFDHVRSATNDHDLLVAAKRLKAGNACYDRLLA
ncbi:hypothetical protein U1737_18620 [Sphingomonas sp. LB3N6]|uniref:hypothetical protein n=1 Tax=Sphingomonas fucosidasi TaxID=3096164 RepID=UPI002FCB386A